MSNDGSFELEKLNSNENFSEQIMYIEKNNPNPNQNNIIQESENWELTTPEKEKKRKQIPQYWQKRNFKCKKE